MQDESASAILRSVGIVLIVVGALDIAWMFHVISSGQGYSSSFNIFAVIAGIMLYRQSLRTARIVTVLCAFFLTGFVGLLIAFPLVLPATLMRTYLRVTPMASLIGWGAFMSGALALLWWVHQSLASSPVQEAIRSAGLVDRRFFYQPKSGFWFGAALVAVLVIVFSFVGRSETAQEAVKRARQNKGPGYLYFVSNLSTSWTSETGIDVRATVLAYTDSSIETVHLEWRK